MSWESTYFVCFAVGLALSLVSLLSGGAHLHLGHFGGHFGGHLGGHSGAHAPGHGSQAPGHGAHWLTAINGFTVTGFLCWFGGAGYLLERYSTLVAPLVLLVALASGFAGALLLWAAFFRLLLPRERVLTPEDTAMPGVVARVSNSIRDRESLGEIIFLQSGSRHAAAARSDDGNPIERGAEVLVLRYEHGIAYVRRWDDLA